MSIIKFIKVNILLSLLGWYRKEFGLDDDARVSPLDTTINQIARHIELDVKGIKDAASLAERKAIKMSA